MTNCGSLAWMLGVVVPQVSYFSLHSGHITSSLCVLWRSKLRNTYCTLDCKRLLQNIVIRIEIRLALSVGRVVIKLCPCYTEGFSVWFILGCTSRLYLAFLIGLQVALDKYVLLSKFWSDETWDTPPHLNCWDL